MTHGSIDGSHGVHPVRPPAAPPAHPPAAPVHHETHAPHPHHAPADEAHVHATAAHPDAAWRHAASAAPAGDGWEAIDAHQRHPADRHAGLLDEVKGALGRLGHAVEGHLPDWGIFKAPHKVAQGQAMLHRYHAPAFGLAGTAAPSAAEQHELHDLAGKYMKAWSFEPHGPDPQFSPLPALGLYKTDATIEDLAPNLLALRHGSMEYKYASPKDYIEPMEALYGTTKRFVLEARPQDLHMVKLGSHPDRFEIMTPFKAHLEFKPTGHAVLTGISSLIVERNAHGKLRIAHEVLAPTGAGL